MRRWSMGDVKLTFPAQFFQTVGTAHCMTHCVNYQCEEAPFVHKLGSSCFVSVLVANKASKTRSSEIQNPRINNTFLVACQIEWLCLNSSTSLLPGQKLDRSQQLYVVANRLHNSHLLRDELVVLESILKIEKKPCKNVLHKVHMDLGRLYHSLYEDDKRSLDYFKQAMLTATSLASHIDCSQSVGLTYHYLGRYEAGDRYFQKALEHSKRVPRDVREILELTMQVKQVFTLELRGKGQEAIKEYGKLLKRAKAIKNLEIEQEIHSNLGIACENACDYRKASGHQRQALDLSRQLGDEIFEGASLGHLANDLYQLGEYRETLQVAKEYLQVSNEMQNRQSEGKACGILGSAYEALGDYKNALIFQEKDLQISIELGDKKGVGKTLTNLGLVYQSVGDYEKAIGYFEERLKIARDCGDEIGKEHAHKNLGETYELKGDKSIAIQEYKKYETLALQRNDPKTQAHVCILRGKRCLVAGPNADQYDQAIRCFQQVQTIAKDIGSKDFESVAQEGLGIAKMFTGNIQESKQCFQKGQNIAREQEDVPSLAQHCYKLGLVNLFTRNLVDAESHLNSCIELYEIIRGNIKMQESLKIPIQDKQKDAYKLLQRVQIERGKFEEALVTAESGRARAIADLMQFNLLGDQSPSEVRDDVRSCAETSPVLFYSWFPEICYIWVIHTNGSISFRKLGRLSSFAGGNDLDKQITDFCKSIKKQSLARDIPVNLQPRAHATPPRSSVSDVLYNALIGPVQDLIADSPEIVIVPEGPLYSLPFSALRDQHGRYLSESVRIRIVPSLTTLKLIAKSRLSVKCRRQNILIIGDPNTGMVQEEGKEPELVPRLPFAKQECNMIGEMLHATPLTGTFAGFYRL